MNYNIIISASVLKAEIIHDKLTHLHITNSLQERKTLMANLADGFIALPGGLGTFEEMYEIWNARKIGVCNKPLGLLNIDGYFDFTIAQLKRGVKEGLVNRSHLDLIQCDENPAILLDLILNDITSFEEEANTTPEIISSFQKNTI